jgi:hypothetical protein
MIVTRPCWLYTDLKDTEADSQLFWVYASPLMEPTDEPLMKVQMFLSERCWVLHRMEEIEDEDMMSGAGVLSMYEIFPACPGESTPHAHARKEGA